MEEVDDTTGLVVSQDTTEDKKIDLVDVCWIRSQQYYVLYLVHVDSTPHLAEDIDHVMDRFSALVANERRGQHYAHASTSSQRQMMSLEWRSLSGLVESQSRKHVRDMFTNDAFGDSVFQKWISETQVYQHETSMQAMVRSLKQLLESDLAKARADLPTLHNDKKAAQQEKIPDVTVAPVVTDLQVLDPTSAEYQSVNSQHNGHNFPVSCIKKVNIPQRVSKYNAYKNSLPSNHRNEDGTYHGTKSIAACDSIARSGPDLTLAGTSTGTVFGKGFYTTTQISYAAQYATQAGGMLVCKVAPGVMKVGDPNCTAANISPCHSVTNGDGTFRVLFHPDAVLVEYILSFGVDQSLSEAARLLEEARQKALQRKRYLENQKQAKIEKIASHVKMTAYFISVCESLMRDMNTSNVMFLMKRFKLEAQQFAAKLPMYAYKQEFIDAMSQNKMMILKGGTGIGKTVTVPQWAYDHLLCQSNELSDKRVAVLVPRKLIAATLANRLCSMRECELGDEVGVGTSDEYLTSANTRITFFTYGFFRAIQSSDPLFQTFDIVICDEVHERGMDAEFLMVRLCEASRIRPDLRLIVMSATIDVDKFSTMMAEYSDTKKAPVLLDVPGVTYPVQDIWWDGEPWDPTGPGALDELCVEVLRAFNQDDDGNCLVFVCTARNAIDCADKMRAMVTHDPSIEVASLYASLPEAEKTRVEGFHADPANAGRRMICFATNVAEGGITIPGITLVVDTGRELSVTYDLQLKATVSEMTWISQASQRQRRGRAGRTAPGKCYCLYSEEDFNNNMEENAIPPIYKMNCDTFYLGLVANGLNPDQVSLIDNPPERMEAARQDLIRFGAIEMDNDVVPPVPRVTKRGKAMNQMPVKLPMAKSILVGVQLECAEQVCIIASMMETSERWPLFVGERDQQATNKAKFRTPPNSHNTYLRYYDDHMTLLNLHEQWTKNQRDHHWSNRFGVSQRAMREADETLKRILKILRICNIPFSTCPPDDPNRTDNILSAICAGTTDKVAMAMDPAKPSSGFRLLSGYDTNPIVAILHPSCVIGKHDQAALVVYHGRTVGQNGTHMISCVSSVKVEHVLMAHENIMPKEEFDKFKSTFLNLQHETFRITFSPNPCKTHEMVAFGGNVKEVQNDYPLTVIKQKPEAVAGSNAKTAVVLLSCPPPVRAEIEARLQEAFRLAQDHVVKIDNVPNYSTHVNSNGSLTVACQKFRDSLRTKFSADKIQLYGCTTEPSLEVKAMGAIIDSVVADVQAYACGIGGGSGITVGPSDASPDELQRMAMLVNPNTTKAQIVAKYGEGLCGSMFLLAHHVAHHTNMHIYGGYIRDFLIRGDYHDAMDLDLAIPPNTSPDTQAASVSTCVHGVVHFAL